MWSCDINIRVLSQNDKRFWQEPGDGLVIRLMSMAAVKGLSHPSTAVLFTVCSALIVLAIHTIVYCQLTSIPQNAVISFFRLNTFNNELGGGGCCMLWISLHIITSIEVSTADIWLLSWNDYTPKTASYPLYPIPISLFINKSIKHRHICFSPVPCKIT